MQTIENQGSYLDQLYETREEAAIANMLRQYGIPFLYRQAVLVQENGSRHVIRPSFSLPTYNNAVIDYVAGDGSKNGKERKKDLGRLYTLNSIDAVLMDTERLNSPSWQHDLYDKLNDNCKHRCNVLPSGYRQD